MLAAVCVLLSLGCLSLSLSHIRMVKRIKACEDLCENLRHAHDSLAEFSLKAVRGHE